MTPLLFRVPSEFANPAVYERFGAVIKDRATGQIASLVQETSGWNALRHLPIPGGNPLGLITDVIQMGQLAKIQQTLNTVQTLATVGAVASVASVGVSVAGFAIVLSKLNRMDRKLDRMLGESAKVRVLAERVHAKLDALPMATLRAELEAVGLAGRFEPARRRASLQRSTVRLAELRHYYAALLADQQFCSLGTDNLLGLLDTHERLVAACEGELHAEFLLDSDAGLVAERWRLQKQALDAVAWDSPEALYELAEQGDRDLGIYMVTTAADRRRRVTAIADIREESKARLASLPELSRALQQRGVRADDYLAAVAERTTPEQPLLVLDVLAKPEGKGGSGFVQRMKDFAIALRG